MEDTENRYTCAHRTVNISAQRARSDPSTLDGMAGGKTPRADAAWWAALARPLVRDYEPSMVALSKELARAVGRKKPWNHAALVRFVATGGCSSELSEAISTFFKLPRPAFVARSAKEAFEMQGVASKYDNLPISETEAEIADLRARLEEKERELEARAARDAEQAGVVLKRKHR